DHDEVPWLPIDGARRESPSLEDPAEYGVGYGPVLVTPHGQDGADGLEDVHRVCLSLHAPGSEARAGERHIGVLPGGLEAALGVGRLGVAVLRAERLGEPEQRPAVLRVLAQVLPVDGFGVR